MKQCLQRRLQTVPLTWNQSSSRESSRTDGLLPERSDEISRRAVSSRIGDIGSVRRVGVPLRDAAVLLRHASPPPADFPGADSELSTNRDVVR